jgi:hypothetical protein
MKSAPVPPFIMSQAQFLFQFLVVSLDNPALFGYLDQILEFGLRR